MVDGASYRFKKNNEEDYIFSFFTGQRSNGIGYLEEGVLDFGLGRSLSKDDMKGLPDGTPDDQT